MISSRNGINGNLIVSEMLCAAYLPIYSSTYTRWLFMHTKVAMHYCIGFLYLCSFGGL